MNKKTTRNWMRVAAALLCLLLAVPAFAAIAIPKPTERFFVNDFAGVLSPETESALFEVGKQVQQDTGAQLVFVSINSLEGNDLEEYALEIGRQWGIGQKGKDNGLLILLVMDSHDIRIEVGTGLEGNIPDILTARVREKFMTPYYRDGDFDKGTTEGYKAFARRLYAAYQLGIPASIGDAEDEQTIAKGDLTADGVSGTGGSSDLNMFWIVLCVIGFFWLMTPIRWIFRTRRHMRAGLAFGVASALAWKEIHRASGGRHGGGGWGGGGFGGGGFGGGGGFSGGGGGFSGGGSSGKF